MAIKSNIIIDQGSDYTVTVDLTDANGNTMVLSGYSGRASMRKSFTSSTSKDFTVSINGSAGEVTLSMDSDYTANIAAGRYLYDIEVVSSANVVTRILQGIATISPEITR